MKFNFLFFLLPLVTFGQLNSDAYKMPNVIPPSPTVASLMQFEEVPIDYHTGQPDISIPLLTKQIDKELTMPLVLKYSTLGVRIQSKSGWMGTGWALDAGGVISRTVLGVADEKKYDNEFKTTGAYFTDFKNFYNKTLEERNEYGWNMLGTSDGNYDSDYDLYQFSMLGITGRFIVDGNYHVKILSEDQNIKIEPELAPSELDSTVYIITAFKITDTNGYEYFFRAREQSTCRTVSFVQPRFPQDQEGLAPVTSKWSDPINSAWHLTKIRKNNKDLVTFEYRDVEETNKTFSQTEYRISSDFIVGLQANDAIHNPYNRTQLRPQYTTLESELVTQTKKISKINFLQDGTALKFEMLGSLLKNIKYIQETGSGGNVLTNNLKDIDFNQWGSIDRPWLNEITINDSIKYKLDYYDKESLPGYSQYGGDVWGFCKADYRGESGDYDKNAYRRGLLTSIQYPTGGKKEFDWEPHSFSFEGANQITDYNIYDNNPYNNLPVVPDFEHSFDIDLHTSVLDSGETINFTHDQYVAASLVLDPSSNINSSSPYFNLFEVCFGNNNWVSINELPKNIAVRKGSKICQVRVKPGAAIASSSRLKGKIKIKYRYIPMGGQYNYTVLGGGARIKTIKFTDPNSGKPFEKMLGYDYSMEGTIEERGSYPWENDTITVKISSGAVDSKLGNSLKEYDLFDEKYLFAQSGSYKDVLGVREIPYKVITGQANVQLSKGGNYVSYTKVKEYELTQIPLQYPGGSIIPLNHNGYTEYNYTGVPDFPSPAETFTYPYKPQPNLEHKRGLLKSKIVYNSDNLKLLEIQNTKYDYPETVVDTVPFIWERNCQWKQFYDKWENYADTYPDPGVQCMIAIESEFTAQCFCAGELSECYQNCGLGMAVYISDVPLISGRAELKESIKTEYFYKDGIVSSTETKTTYDYNQENYQLKEQVDYLRERNTLNAYKTTYEYPLGGYNTTLFTQDEVTANNSLVQANVINKPLVISSYKNGALLQRVVNKYKYDSNWGLIPQIKEVEVQKENYPLEDRILYHDYDHKGNVLKVSMPGGMFVYYIWGYGETLPVAKIETADENFNTDSIIEGLLESIHENSFHDTYNEGLLIDNLNALRSQLPDAMVTTLTHEPGIGVKTVTDPRGITMTYEYDEQGRLKSVRDNQGNLVSEHKYRYRTQED